MPGPWGFGLGAAKIVAVTCGTSDMLHVGQMLFSGECALPATAVTIFFILPRSSKLSFPQSTSHFSASANPLSSFP